MPEPERTAPRVRGGDLLPWAALVLFTAGALALVAKFGVNVPFFDEWDDTVPRLTGAEPVTPSWLWAPHNEHRIPLPRLLLLAFLRLGGGDFRVAMFANVLLLAAATAALLASLRASRTDRRLRPADAVIPALVLCFGGAQNWIWGFQVQFAAAAALVLCALAAALRLPAGTAPRSGASLAAGACVLLLPLCGANGLVFAAPLALWCLYRGLAAPRNGAGSASLLAAGAGTLALCGAYLVGLPRPPAPASPPPVSPFTTGAEFLAAGLGGGTQGTTPDDGRGPSAASLATLAGLAALLAFAAAAAARRFRESPEDRPPIVALAAIALGVLVMAAGVGSGRAVFGAGAGFASRYVLPASLLPLCLYLTLMTVRPAAVVAALCAVVVVLLPANVARGLRVAEEQNRAAASFVAMARAGLPLSALTSVGVGRVHNSGESLNIALRRMRTAGFAPFAAVPDDPRVRALSLKPEEVRLAAMEPAGPITFRPTGAGGGLAWRFDAPPDAFAVLIRYRTATPVVPGAHYRVTAVPADEGSVPADWREGVTDKALPQAPDGGGAVVYPCRPISGVEIRVSAGPDGAPPALTLEEAVVMVRRRDVAGGGRGTAGDARN